MSYQRNKARAIELAQNWQYDFANHDYSYGELAEYQEFFTSLGRRYGLLTEFRENGIC